MRDLERVRRGSGFFYLCAFVTIAALVLGGGTRSGFLSDAILQLIALPLLILSLWRLTQQQAARSRPWLVAFCSALVLIPVLQTLPLPPSLWTELPNRKPEVEALELVGRGLPWMPVSVAPHATALAVLSLIVPIAIFLGTVQLRFEERSRLSLVIIAAGLLSVLLGLSQVAQGPDSALRFFDFKNTSEAIGFFANRNHFAALLYSVTLLAAAWAVNAIGSASGGAPTDRYDAAAIIALVASFTVMVMLVAAQAVARSRGGLGLTIVALLGALVLAFSDRRGAAGVTPRRCSRPRSASPRCLRRSSRSTASWSASRSTPCRIRVSPSQRRRSRQPGRSCRSDRGWAPSRQSTPRLKGPRTSWRTPTSTAPTTTCWLELGVAGIALMLVFLGWYAVRSFALWRRTAFGPSEINTLLARSATLIVGLLIAHSVVDYPLRTGAMMAVFAFACALLTEPPGAGRRAAESKAGVRGAEDHGRGGWAAPEPGVAVALPQDAWPKGERWGKNVEWPEEWKQPGPPQRPKPGGR